MLRTMMAILLAVTLLQAQDKPAEVKQEPREAVIIPVKTLTGDSFDRLVKLLGVFKADYTADKNMRTILVYASKDVVEQMRKVVNELDRPGSEAAMGRNIDMTMTFLKCSTKPPAEGAAVLPADLEPVAKQLRAATQYKDIELLDVVPLHLQEGKTTVQMLRLPGSTNADIRVQPEAVTRRDQGRYVRFSTIFLSFQIPVGPATNLQSINSRLDTSGDFIEGQKTVLGKVSGSEDTAIFVVITFKVLD